MKALRLIIPVLLLAACGQPAVKDASAVKHELAGILYKQQNAWNTGNLEGFMDGYSRDSSMQFITRKGVRKGWQATLEGYKKSYPNKDSMGFLEFRIQRLEILDKAGDIGHITGTWKLTRRHDSPSGFFSLITRRENGVHRIILDHTW